MREALDWLRYMKVNPQDLNNPTLETFVDIAGISLPRPELNAFATRTP
jgi:hypothetical protein